MIVADASLIVAYLARGPDTELAEAVRGRGDFWIAPPHWRIEFLSAIWRMLKAGRIELRPAFEVIEHLDRVVSHSLAVDPSAVLQVALAAKHSPHDCEYVVPVRERFPDVAIAPSRFIHDISEPA